MSKRRSVIVQMLVVATALLAIKNATLLHRMREVVTTHELELTTPAGAVRGALWGENDGVMLVVEDDSQILGSLSLLSTADRIMVRLYAPIEGTVERELLGEVPVAALAEALAQVAHDAKQGGRAKVVPQETR